MRGRTDPQAILDAGVLQPEQLDQLDLLKLTRGGRV
jgi:hypothetical protein